jgi:2-methylcitrate dehydratase
MASDDEKWHPTTRETADHSLPYVVAVALMYGSVETRYFDNEYIQNPALMALIQKIKVTATEEANKLRPEANFNRVEVVTKSGKKFSETVLYWRGHFKNPLTDKEIEDKFNSQARDLLTSEQRQQLLSLIWNLEKTKDVSRIMELLKV